VSLRPSDDRRENERAVECYQQAMLELCAKFGRVIDRLDPPILNLPDYAARVAHNVANEQLRPPNWSRLSNRVRRVLSKDASLDVWDDADQGKVALGLVVGGQAGGRSLSVERRARHALGELR
jgi:hypothetical protein